MTGELEGWGATLSPTDRAAAAAARVIALGLAARERVTAEELRRALAELVGGRRTQPLPTWRLLRTTWRRSDADPPSLAKLWREAVPTDAALRVALPAAGRLTGADARFARALFDILGPLPGAAVAVSLYRSQNAWRSPHWPLRIGIPQGMGGATLGQTVRNGEFFRVSEVSDAATDWDLLVVDAWLLTACEMLASRPTRLTARVVVVVRGDHDVSSAGVPGVLTRLRTVTGASAVAVVDLGSAAGTPPTLAALLSAISDEIGHDRPLDAAIAAGARGVGARLGFVVGDERFLSKSNASERVRSLGRKLVATASKGLLLPPLEHFSGFEALASARGPSAVPHESGARAKAIGETLATHADEADWSRERRAASGSSRLATAVSDSLERAARDAPPRYLQCQTREVRGAKERVVRTLISKRAYALYIWIGPADVKAFALPTSFPSVSPEPAEHELDVVVHDPELLGKPLLGRLKLPPVGAAKPCRFSLVCTPGVERIEARVVVLHRGRVLQTGVLRGPIAPAAGAPAEELSFVPDAMPRRRLQKLGSRSSFGAAIVANHFESGRAEKLAIVGTKVASIKLNETTLQALVARFGAAISDAATAEADYAKLRSRGNVALLRDLAQHGSALHRTLLNHAIVGAELVKKTRLQIVAARPDSFLPLELAYTDTSPEDDATLCAGAEEALERGGCPVSCSRGGSPPGGTDTRICPMGFWCMTKVIERYEHDPAHTQQADDYALYAAEALGDRPTLAAPTRAIVAASKFATEYDKKAIDKIVAANRGLQFERATDWKDWIAKIGTEHPSLLVLLPHHVDEAGATMLELGTDSRLKSTNVKPRHTVGEPAPDMRPQPIVFLLGCETTQSLVALESFPAAFLDSGAALVLGTIATVLGRDAAATAARLIALLAASKGDVAFGDLLIAARRQLVRDGKVMALALAGFGDADWRIS